MASTSSGEIPPITTTATTGIININSMSMSTSESSANATSSSIKKASGIDTTFNANSSSSSSSPKEITREYSTGIERTATATNSTSSSTGDKKTTKLSTGSINESTNLNSPSGGVSDSDSLHLLKAKKMEDDDDEFKEKVEVGGGNITENKIHRDGDDDEAPSERNSKNGRNNANNNIISHQNSQRDHHHLLENGEFSESSASNTSTESSSGGNGKGSRSGLIKNKTTLRAAGQDEEDDMNNFQISGTINVVGDLKNIASNNNNLGDDQGSLGKRKRELNRRKSSEPVQTKKLLKLGDSEDEEEYDDEPDLEDEFGISPDGDEDYDLGFSLDFTGQSPAYLGDNSGLSGVDLTRSQKLISRFNNNNNTSGKTYPLADPVVQGLKDCQVDLEEKLINSSNSEYETSITPSLILKSHYHLRWKNHQTHILLAFESLLQNETFCDVTLICDPDKGPPAELVKNKKIRTGDKENARDTWNGNCRNDKKSRKDDKKDQDSAEVDGVLKLKAHKIVLSACSEYFQRIFAENPCKHPVIVLKDYQAWEVQALIDFMYRGEVDVSLERLPSLVKSAESLQIRGLTDTIGKLGPELFQRCGNFYPKRTPQSELTSSSSPSMGNNHKKLSSRTMMPSPEFRPNLHEALNLSMEGSIKRKSLEIIERSDSNSPRNINTGKPQSLRETSMLQIHSVDVFQPTCATTTVAATTNHHHHHYQHHHRLEDHQGDHLLPEDHGQNSGNEGEINQSHTDFHILGGSTSKQSLLPRRKQARPRRRSGDYIAQDLRKVINSPEYNRSNLEISLEHLQAPSENKGSREDSNSQQSHQNHHHKRQHHHSQQEHHLLLDEDVEDEAEDGLSQRSIRRTVMARLAQRRRSSRRHNQDRDLLVGLPMNLRNNNRSNSNNNRDDNNGPERIIDEEQNQNRGLDYTLGLGGSGSTGGSKKLKIKGISQGVQFPGPGHLPFLRNWSPTMNSTRVTPPLGLQRGSPLKPNDGDSDDGISSTADHCQSPPISPSTDHKNFLAHLQQQSRHHLPNHSSPHDFPLFGLHPDHPAHAMARNANSHHLNLPLNFNKQSPPSPSSFFMNPMGSMSITPLGGNHSGNANNEDEPGADTVSTPPSTGVYSSSGYQLPMQLTQGNHHLFQHHHHPPGKEERETQERGGGGGRGAKNDPTRGSPVGWPGLPLGPPPIFGRHRAQHSAPRGGPPRAWSNADLTEALHNVWNKKMTTSQASRIFGIPYNSLLMYVRGKYGKSLKLDLLKKGLDQALENSQNQNSSNTLPSNSTTNPSVSSSNQINASNSTSTTSPTSASNNININNNANNNMMNSSPSSTLSTSSSGGGGSNSNNNGKNHHHHLTSGGGLSALNEHNNNNPTAVGMGHILHQKSGKSHSTGLELPHELPPGFNPFSAASLFGEYPSPFPFASALSHIIPQANLVNQQHQHGLGHHHHHHPALSGLGLNLGTRGEKVIVGDDDK